MNATNTRMKAKVNAALDLLQWAVDNFGDKVEQGTSFGMEGMVLIDLCSRIKPRPAVFTLDTGRLHDETYKLMDLVRRRYKLRVSTYYPDTARVEQMVKEHGINLFYESPKHRTLCCQVRKLEPFERAVKGLSAWITGLRQEQSVFRAAVSPVDNSGEGPVKISPLADWSSDEVWAYIRDRDIPYNRLHDQNYPSVGCAPCTRPVGLGENPRSGRWWWENDSHKECGLHDRPRPAPSLVTIQP